MYSINVGPRCFKWKMLSLSGPKVLPFLLLLIALITRSAVNVGVISHGSLVTIRVSLEEVCLPSFEVLNCWLKFVASCLDDGQVCLLVHGFNKFSPFCCLCTQMRF